jgi:hypothetical protein
MKKESMTGCQNCGHNSHCGGPLWKEVVDYPSEQQAEYRQIEVCKHCRCESCESKTDKKKS